MKYITFLCILFLISVNLTAKVKNIGFYETNKKSITVLENKRQIDWAISPEENPDRLRIYCDTKDIEVSFLSLKSPLTFKINENDTIRFAILLNNRKDTAYTEVIGVREFPDHISTTEKLYHLSRLWSEVKYNFVNIDMISFDWDSLYYAYIPQVASSKNDYAYYRLLSRFLASLKDGHTDVHSGLQFFNYEDYIPMSLREFDNRIYITDIKKGIGLDSTFLGGEIIEISGIKTQQYMQDSIFPYISASTEQHLRMQGIGKVQYALKENNFKAKVKKADGNIEFIDIKRNGETTRTPDDAYYKISKGPNRTYQAAKLNWLTDSIAHLEITAFYPEERVISALQAVEDEVSDAKGLIIDIRNNGGGSTRVAWYLQSLLSNNDYLLNYAWETRINDGVKKANGNWIEEYADFYLGKAYRKETPDTIFIADTIKRFTMPTAILIGPYTFSAAEDFLVNIYEVPDRPILIGEPTGGSTGSPLVIDGLPGDGYARICTRRICYPYSRKPFVNEGIKPDIILKQSFQNYTEDKDIVLEKAVEYLKEKK